ncbi:MAG: 4Fe-4S binding protein [Alkalinema sp. CAN_BIN05]|nr:4Fe-4S binding protein [Alkalinema sp. CAN_BIN05]
MRSRRLRNWTCWGCGICVKPCPHNFMSVAIRSRSFKFPVSGLGSRLGYCMLLYRN